VFGALSKAEYAYFRITVAVESPLKAEYLLWSASEYILWVDSKFFTKTEENLLAKHLEGGSKKGGHEASASLATP